MITIQEIIDRANNIADETIETETVQHWVQDAVAKFNTFWPALVQIPDLVNLDDTILFTIDPQKIDGEDISDEDKAYRIKQYRNINDIYINRAIIPYVAYKIKVQDESNVSYVDMYNEWVKDLRKLQAAFGNYLAPEYTLGSLQESERMAGRFVKNRDSDYTYGQTNTWGPLPSAGNSTKGGLVRSSSGKFYGKGR